MTLKGIVVFTVGTAIYGLIVPARWRGWVLLAASVIAIYWLQPSSPVRPIDFVLPTATLDRRSNPGHHEVMPRLTRVPLYRHRLHNLATLSDLEAIRVDPDVRAHHHHRRTPILSGQTGCYPTANAPTPPVERRRAGQSVVGWYARQAGSHANVSVTAECDC